MKDPIIITGAARAGVGLVAGVFDACGLWFNNKPSDDKKRLSFSNVAVSIKVVQPLLAKLGCDPLGQYPLPVTGQLTALTDEFVASFKQAVTDIVRRQRQHENGDWGIVDTTALMLWYVWNKAFPNAVWIVVRRNPEDVVTSCIKTAYMKAYDTRPGWMGWIAVYEKRFEELLDSKATVFQVWPQRAVDGDYAELQIVVKHLGLEWDLRKIKPIIQPALWHKNKKEKTDDCAGDTN